MIDGAMVALGISPEGRPVPIQLTAAGLLAVSGGSGGAGNGAFVGGYTLIGIAPDGTRVPIAVDSNGIIQTSGGSGDATAQAANTVQAGPTSGAAALPTYRSLVGADLPSVITKATSFTANGAASTPAVSLNGTIFTGGSATTTKPQLLIEPAGTTSTGWSTTGTMLGVNAPSGFTGNLFDAQLVGTSKFKITSAGTGLFPDGSATTPSIGFSSLTGRGLFYITGSDILVAAGNLMLGAAGAGAGRVTFNGDTSGRNGSVAIDGAAGIVIGSTKVLSWSSSTFPDPLNALNIDTALTRLAAASLQLGATASATPIAYTLTVGESSRGGTDTNVAGASGTFASGRGTGTGAASSLIFQTPTVGSTGTTQQTLATRFTIATAGLTAAVPILLPSGTVGSLSLSWSSSPNDGIFISGGANMCFVSAGHLDFRNNGSAGGIVFSNGYGVGFESGNANGPDLFLYRDAPNVLALRNGTTAQELRVYGNYTDASNYERFTVTTASGYTTLATKAAGTGTSPILQIGTIGSSRIEFFVNNSVFWQIGTSGYLVAQANLNIWNGTSALATTATAGFLGVNSCAGVPSGTPTSIPTGQIPQVWDSTNKRANYYSGGAWVSITADGQPGSGPVVLKSYVVSGLPAAVAGGLAYVTDATTTAITGLGLAVVGGGANKVICYSDGVSWLVL